MGRKHIAAAKRQLNNYTLDTSKRCECGHLPEWYCLIWKDKVWSQCVKDMREKVKQLVHGKEEDTPE